MNANYFSTVSFPIIIQRKIVSNRDKNWVEFAADCFLSNSDS